MVTGPLMAMSLPLRLLQQLRRVHVVAEVCKCFGEIDLAVDMDSNSAVATWDEDS